MAVMDEVVVSKDATTSVRMALCSFHASGAEEPVYEVSLVSGSDNNEVTICAACAQEALDRIADVNVNRLADDREG